MACVYCSTQQGVLTSPPLGALGPLHGPGVGDDSPDDAICFPSAFPRGLPFLSPIYQIIYSTLSLSVSLSLLTQYLISTRCHGQVSRNRGRWLSHARMADP